MLSCLILDYSAAANQRLQLESRCSDDFIATTWSDGGHLNKTVGLADGHQHGEGLRINAVLTIGTLWDGELEDV